MKEKKSEKFRSFKYLFAPRIPKKKNKRCKKFSVQNEFSYFSWKFSIGFWQPDEKSCKLFPLIFPSSCSTEISNEFVGPFFKESKKKQFTKSDHSHVNFAMCQGLAPVIPFKPKKTSTSTWQDFWPPFFGLKRGTTA